MKRRTNLDAAPHFMRRAILDALERRFSDVVSTLRSEDSDKGAVEYPIECIGKALRWMLAEPPA